MMKSEVVHTKYVNKTVYEHVSLISF